MAKKIKFALKLKDGADVRTLEALQEHFDLEKVTAYLLDGKLLEWLEDRYYDEEAEKIRALDKDAKDFHKQLCNALGAPYEGEDEIDIEALERLNEKREKLQQLTADKDIIANADKTAFSQEDLAELLDEDEHTIYLCGEKFTIPVRVSNRKYIGILGKPEIKITAETPEELAKKEIFFENVLLPEHLRTEQPKKEENSSKAANRKLHQTYQASKLLDFKMSDKDREEAAKIFDAAQDILGNITFDIDVGSRRLLEAAKASNLRGGLQRYLERIG